MIRLKDAFVLASTKLHVRRLRTIITIALSSLLFSALIASIIIFQGITKSVTSFNSEGLNNRFIVSAQADPIFAGNVLGSKEFVALAQQKGKDLIVTKQAEAKRLGIDYNVGNEPSATFSQTVPGQESTTHVNIQSYAVIEALQEYAKQHPSPGINELKQTIGNYHSIGIYTSVVAGLGGGNLSTMVNGNENFTPTTDQQTNINFLNKTSLVIDDSQLTKPFILPNISIKKDYVPLVVSYSTAEKLLGLPQLSSNATASERYERIQQLYKLAADGNMTATTCYRNGTSRQQIDQAVNQAAEIAKNANNKDYQKPELIYGLPPTDSCGQVQIISDARTAAERKAQASQDVFNAEFGQAVAPIQQKLTFQVVGLSPSVSSNYNTSFGDLLSGVVGSSLINGSDVIPTNLLDQMSNATTIKSILLSNVGSPLNTPGSSYYVEFANAADARAFINDKSCTTESDGICASPGHLFQLMTSGNNSIALDDLLKQITKIITIATIIIAILAIIIMTSMVGRTITDSRRETAIFRAIGAKRGDIVVIYTAYTLCLTIFIVAISLLIGIGFAYGFNMYYAHNSTLQAKLLFDAVNSNLSFNFFDINILFLSIVIAIIFITGLISVFIPLIRNVSRSPIKDMREE